MLISCNKSNDIKEIDIPVNNKSDNITKNSNGIHILIDAEKQNKIREEAKAKAEAEERDKILAEAEQKAKEDAKLKAEQKAKEDAKAKELNAKLSIDKFKLKYSDLWQIEKETASHIELKNLSGTFNFEITKRNLYLRNFLQEIGLKIEKNKQKYKLKINEIKIKKKNYIKFYK